MTRNEVTDLGCDEQLFRRVVKATFNQRRKMLRVSLRQLLPADARLFTQNAELLTRRPEQLSIPEFIGLTNMVEGEMRDEG
jgi:16S rRNA (adenine1518-N6/adenine1519-N6)-dimethyltransferase